MLDPKIVAKALMTARSVASNIDPAFGRLVAGQKDGSHRVVKAGGGEVHAEMPEEHKKLFAALADQQRGDPEKAMLAANHRHGGIMSPVIEHVGDITNRIAKHVSWGHPANEMAAGHANEKAARGLHYLEQTYGFQKEHEQNMRSNAQYRGIPYEEYKKDLDSKLKNYADEHRKLPAYNEPLYRAREAAVALGDQRWIDAATHLRWLKHESSDKPSFVKKASEMDPHYADPDRGIGIPRITKAGGGALGRMQRREDALHAGVPERMGTNIVKDKGGQWLSGSVENAVRPYGGTLVSGEGADTNPLVSAHNIKTKAVNDFLSKQLTRYIKNDMGTPHDPVRELAERGITHFPDPVHLEEEGAAQHGRGHNGYEDYGWKKKQRELAGYPIEGSGKSNLAKGWESRADLEISTHRAKDFLYNKDHEYVTEVMKNNPWLSKVDSETRIHGSKDPSMSRLGFDHLVDELHNSTAPGSDLPDHLQLRPESLARMSVPQAVQHVHNVNEWRKGNKAKADAKRAFNPATYLHKDYPGEDYAWYELKSSPDVTPAVPAVYGPGPHQVTGAYPQKFDTEEEARNYVKEFPEQIRKANDKGQFDPILKQFEQYPLTYIGQSQETVTPAIPAGEDKHLKDALKYEGDCMGHCVGGYHEEVANGNSRIFSLRHKKTGAPHVTIGTAPIMQYLKGPAREEINQIKGKGNAAPIDKYKLFVQDFVKSKPWAHVGDLQNSGLVQHPATGEYMTSEERASHPGYAAGGAIDSSQDDSGPQPNQLGLYSQAAEAARALPQEKGTPQQMIASLKGVKPDELKWSGVHDAFKDRKTITKHELADHFEQNLPNLEVHEGGGKFKSYATPGGQNYREKLFALQHEDPYTLFNNRMREKHGAGWSPEMLSPEDRAEHERTPYTTSEEKTQYQSSHWNQPNVILHQRLSDRMSGGTSAGPRPPKPDKTLKPQLSKSYLSAYGQKEVPAWSTGIPGLVVHKSLDKGKAYNLTHEPSGMAVKHNMSWHHAQDLAKRIAPLADWSNPDPTHFKKHFSENPDKEAQRRKEFESVFIPPVSKRAKPPEKLLHLDELQSDWGQQMRKYGIRDQQITPHPNATPTAPYVGNTQHWTDLGLKQALHEAAHGDYDKLIWTPGKEQADRYKLSKSVGRVTWRPHKDTPNVGVLEAFSPQPKGRYMGAPKTLLTRSMSASDIDSHIGKEAAERLRSSTPNNLGIHQIQGEDLNLGGHGMIGYYDNILPKRLLALAREHDPEAKLSYHKDEDKNVNGFPALEITPKMRESIKKRGFKAYSTGGFINTMDPHKDIRKAMMIAKGRV